VLNSYEIFEYKPGTKYVLQEIKDFPERATKLVTS